MCPNALTYAEILLRLAQSATHRQPPGLVLAAWRQPSETYLRVRHLLTLRHLTESRAVRALALLGVALLLSASTALGMLTFSDTSTAAQARAAELRGVAFLLARQEPSGGWLTATGPAPTALATRALLQAGVPLDHPAILRARRYLASCQQEDGGFYSDMSPAYQTAVVLSLYAGLDDADARARVARGREFLRVLEAPADPTPAPNWTPANYAGGAASERSADCILETYGRLSYANWKSLAYAELRPADPRVQQSRRWLQRNWTLQNHPGTGSADGQYYFLMAATRTLAAARGSAAPAGGGGKAAHWADDAQAWLTRVQNPDGSWVNARSGQWMENRPELVTAYALLALQAARAPAETPAASAR